MPLYEYKCKSCGTVFEVIQKFSDEPLSIHEACGGPVERLISPSAFHFKGTGWYVTDYARGNKNGQPPAGRNGGGDKSAKSEPKTESKPAAKSESKSESKAAPAAKK